MSRKVCKRKKWALVNPITHAIEGACITSQADCNQLLMTELSALEAMVHGQGTLQEWSDLKGVLNLCSIAAKRHGVGHEAIESCDKAQQALIQAARRFESTGSMGLSGEGIQALRDVIEWHDLQRRSIPRSQYELIIRDAMNRVKSKAPEVVEI